MAAVTANGLNLTKENGMKDKKLIVIVVCVLVVLGVAANGGSGGAQNAGGSQATQTESSGQSQSSTSQTSATQTSKPQETNTEPAKPKSFVDDTLAKLGDFEETTVTGVGDDVIDLPAPGFPCIMEISHNGSRNFIVHTVDASGSDVDLLVNTIGSYSGVVTDYERFNDAAMLSISADGDWSVTFKPLKSMARLENGGQVKGDCIAYIDEASLTKINISNSGERNFIVKGIGLTKSDLLVNEIGPYDGKVVWSQPQSFFIVQSDGTWSISW